MNKTNICKELVSVYYPSEMKRGLVRRRSSGGKKRSSKITLERVIGCTVRHNSAFTVHPIHGDVAYPSGGVVVVYSVKKNKQVKVLLPPTASAKNVSALVFSPSGDYLAVGEAGHQPSIHIVNATTGAHVAEIKRPHRFGISCLAFSPIDEHLLVSVGFQHDGTVSFWDWRTPNGAIASKKVGSKVFSTEFTADGLTFITAGYRHFKFWSVPAKANDPGYAKPTSPVVLEGHQALLGSQRMSTFTDFAIGGEFVYAITLKGLLCAFRLSNRMLEKWVDLKVKSATAISCTPDKDLLSIGCSESVVRLFRADGSMQYVATLPRPSVRPTQSVSVSSTAVDQIRRAAQDAASGVSKAEENMHAKCDVVGLRFLHDSRHLGVVYSNRHVAIWDVRRDGQAAKKRFGLRRYIQSHSSCVWDLCMIPETPEVKARFGASRNVFATCSADNSIRFWASDLESGAPLTSDLLDTIFVGGESSLPQTADAMDEQAYRMSAEVPPADTAEIGVRCMSLSPDGSTLACGDRSGTIRTFSLKNNMDLESVLEAHDNEILSLQYAYPLPTDTVNDSNLLASGSRDRLIHIFDVNKSLGDPRLVYTLDDHSSSVTAVAFANVEVKLKSGGSKRSLRLISSAADKSLIYRDVNCRRTDPNGPAPVDIRRIKQVMSTQGTVYDMVTDPLQKFAICASKKLTVFSAKTGKVMRTFGKNEIDAPEPVAVAVDPSGLYVAACCSDKTIRIYDFFSDECIAVCGGHSELVTAVSFTADTKQLISVCGDGCIFVWRLSDAIAKAARERIEEIMSDKQLVPGTASAEAAGATGAASVPAVKGQAWQTPVQAEAPKKAVAATPEDLVPHLKLSDTSLPAWAKQRSTDDKHAAEQHNRPSTAPMAAPAREMSEEPDDRPLSARGRWGDRVGAVMPIEESIRDMKGGFHLPTVDMSMEETAKEPHGSDHQTPQKPAGLAALHPVDDSDSVLQGEEELEEEEEAVPLLQTKVAPVETVGMLESDDEEDDTENNVHRNVSEEKLDEIPSTDVKGDFHVDQKASASHGAAHEPAAAQPAVQDVDEDEFVDSELQNDDKRAAFEKVFGTPEFMKKNFESLREGGRARQGGGNLRESLTAKFFHKRLQEAADEPQQVKETSPTKVPAPVEKQPVKAESPAKDDAISEVVDTPSTKSVPEADQAEADDETKVSANTSEDDLTSSIEEARALLRNEREKMKADEKRTKIADEVVKTRERLLSMGLDYGVSKSLEKIPSLSEKPPATEESQPASTPVPPKQVDQDEKPASPEPADGKSSPEAAEVDEEEDSAVAEEPPSVTSEDKPAEDATAQGTGSVPETPAAGVPFVSLAKKRVPPPVPPPASPAFVDKVHQYRGPEAFAGGVADTQQIVGTKEKRPVNEVALSRNPDEYKKALASLQQSFSASLAMFEEVSSVRESMASHAEGNKNAESLYQGYRTTLEDMQLRISTLLGSSTSNASSVSASAATVRTAPSVEDALERYSSLLVDMVKQKLQN